MNASRAKKFLWDERTDGQNCDSNNGSLTTRPKPLSIKNLQKIARRHLIVKNFQFIRHQQAVILLKQIWQENAD